MSNKIKVKTQFGVSATADFEEMLWSFQMPENFRLVSGDFAIVDMENYNELLSILKDCKGYFLRNDKSVFEQSVFSRIDRVSKSLESGS